jgi:hypothetical protein
MILLLVFAHRPPVVSAYVPASGEVEG